MNLTEDDFKKIKDIVTLSKLAYILPATYLFKNTMVLFENPQVTFQKSIGGFSKTLRRPGWEERKAIGSDPMCEIKETIPVSSGTMASAAIQKSSFSFCPLEICSTMTNFVSDFKHESSRNKRDRLCEGRVSRTVLCEDRGETPPPDQISIGIITDILMRIYIESQQKRPFSIKHVYIGGQKLDRNL